MWVSFDKRKDDTEVFIISTDYVRVIAARTDSTEKPKIPQSHFFDVEISRTP